MFTNKHVVIALIVCPVLAILAWIGVGQIAGERASAAVSGQSYPLVEKSDCRYASGHCKLENEDFKLRLSIERRGLETVLVLSSVFALEGVLLSVAEPESEVIPSVMTASDAQNMEWVMSLRELPSSSQRIYLVASSGGAQYFGDAATLFMQRQE